LVAVDRGIGFGGVIGRLRLMGGEACALLRPTPERCAQHDQDQGNQNDGHINKNE